MDSDQPVDKIDTRELRKRNLVEYADGGGFTLLSALEIYLIDIGKVQVKPVPITDRVIDLFFSYDEERSAEYVIDESLFEHTEQSDPENFFGFTFERDSDGGLYYTGGEGVNVTRTIKYMHELQNLCYELERVELKILGI